MPATDRNQIKEADLEQALIGPTTCFPATKNNANYLVDPLTGKPAVAGAISVNSETLTLSVELWDGRIVAFAAGSLRARTLYPLPVVKVRATGTGAGLEVLIWRGESIKKMFFA